MKIPLILQNPRPRDFFGPEDWLGGDPQDDVDTITRKQKAWDAAYDGLTFCQKVRYNTLGYWS